MESDLFFPITLTQMQAAWISSLLKRFIPCWSKVQIYLQLIHWRRGRLSAPLFLGFPCGSAGKESACHARDLGSIPRLGRSPGEGKGCPLQYSSLENSMDCIVHGVPKSRTRLSDFPFHFPVFLLGESHAQRTLTG